MKTSRRLFLTGTAGLTLGLPLLESLNGQARAAEGDPFLFFMRQGNGVTQADQDEAEGFWPSEEGELSASILESDSERVLSELSPYGRSITAIKGLSYAFEGNGCGHSGGGNQCLTAIIASASAFWTSMCSRAPTARLLFRYIRICSSWACRSSVIRSSTS